MNIDFNSAMFAQPADDAADCLIDCLVDLLIASRAALSIVHYEREQAEGVAIAAVHTLTVAIAIADRLQGGVDELSRLAGRGLWKKQEGAA